jgi:membrane bound O-acyltransferase family protein
MRTPTVNADSKSRKRKRFIWPVAGIVIGTIAASNSFYEPHMTLHAGIAAWCADMVLVLVLSAQPIGARVGVLMAGLFLAVPCFVWAAPLPRGLLMCFMSLPFAAAAALVLAPPIIGFRARLAHLCAWCGKRQVKRHTRSFDMASLLQLIVATVVFAAAIAACKAAPASGLWLPVRWLAGGILVFAFAEMATTCHNFVTAALGISVPPFFQSPHRSASIGEFWTKRWNLAASVLFRKYCFAPLARRGVWLALSATFAVSAVAHVLLAYMAIGRWGISMICGAFFLVQPLLIAVERQLDVRQWRPMAGRAWTLTVLAITSPLFVEPGLQIVEKSWGALDTVLLPTVAALGFVIVFSSIIPLASLASRSAANNALQPPAAAPGS